MEYHEMKKVNGKVQITKLDEEMIDEVVRVSKQYTTADTSRYIKNKFGYDMSLGTVKRIRQKANVRNTETSRYKILKIKDFKNDLDYYYFSEEEMKWIKENFDRVTSTDLKEALELKFNVKAKNRRAVIDFMERSDIERGEKKRRPAGKPCSILTFKDSLYYIDENMKMKRLGRYLYEWYHNIELADDEYIMHANGDRNDFGFDNLVKTNKGEILRMSITDGVTESIELTKTNLNILRLELEVNKIERKLKENRK